MSVKGKFVLWAVRRELERHSEEIRAERERLKSIRTLDELKAWAREKGGALGELARRHGPQVLELLRSELARFAAGARTGKP